VNAVRLVVLGAAVQLLTGCPVAVTDNYTLEPEPEPAGQGGASGDCQDGVLNGNETDLDCGGADCEGCVTGRSCREATDCMSEICAANVCE